MKKAILAVSIILVISLILTVYSATSVGVETVMKLIDESGIRSINLFSDDNISFSNGIEVNRKLLERGFDTDIVGKQEYLVREDSSQQLLLDGLNALTVRADIGCVKIIPAEGDEASAVLRAYSKDSSARGEKYSLEISPDGSLIHLAADADSREISTPELTVYIPSGYKGTLDVQADAGEISVGKIACKGFKAVTAMGRVSAEDFTVDSAEISVNIGEAVVRGEYRVKENMRVAVSTGSLKTAMPSSESFVLEYSVKTGTVESGKLSQDGRYAVTADRGSGTVTLKENGDGTQAVIKAEVNTGKIEFI